MLTSPHLALCTAHCECFIEEEDNTALSYVQGLNLVAGVLLYVLPELLAFVAFEALMRSQCPLYADAVALSGPTHALEVRPVAFSSRSLAVER